MSRGADARTIAGVQESVIQATASFGSVDSANNIEMMDRLLIVDADLHATSAEYGSIVHNAAANGRLCTLKWLTGKAAVLRAKGGKHGNACKADQINLHGNNSVRWNVARQFEQSYGKDGWE